MKNRISFLLRIARLVCLSCLITAVWFLLEPGGTLAFQPPPPPDTPTPRPMPTETSKPTDTPVPTETMAPTDTPMPTDTVVPTPADTSTPLPTETQPATATATAEQPRPADATATPEPGKTSAPAPVANSNDCQSVIEGYVLNSSGQRARGATVKAEADGWSGAMLTDDQGAFGFGGLCAGPTTLQAFLLGGDATAAKTVALTGEDSIKVDLSTGVQATEAPTATATAQPAAAETVSTEAGMPVTGFSGWLLAGASILGVLMLLTAGARRVLNVYELSED